MEKLRELIAKWRKATIAVGHREQERPLEIHEREIIRICADELEAALAASEPAPQPLMGYCERHSWLHEKDQVPTPPCRNWEPEQPCTCFTCPQHGPLLKTIEQRASLAKEAK